MNYKKIFKELSARFSGWGFKLDEITRDKLRMTASLDFKDFDDSAFVSVNVYPEFIAIRYTFDHLPYEPENLDLVNRYNEESFYFKASVDHEDNFFMLEAITAYGDERQAINISEKILLSVFDDDTKDIMIQITDATYE